MYASLWQLWCCARGPMVRTWRCTQLVVGWEACSLHACTGIRCIWSHLQRLPIAGQVGAQCSCSLHEGLGWHLGYSALTPNTSRRKLFQDFIVLMVKALISGLVHGQFWSFQWWVIFTIFKPNIPVLLQLNADYFFLFAWPSTSYFLNAHEHCKCSQEHMCFVEALNQH